MASENQPVHASLRTARTAGIFYLLTIVTGLFAFAVHSRLLSEIGNLAGTACYVVVTLLLYKLFKPVNRGVSLVAALVSLVGCIAGALETLHLSPIPIHSLVFFGVYCLLLGYLIFRSGFMPRLIGVLVAIAGLGWLTYISPHLAKQLLYVPMMTGLLGEGSLTVWLLAGRFHEARRKELV